MLAMTSPTLSFVDEKQFLTVIELILPLHECADPTTAESLHFVADTAAAKEAAADPIVVEPLHNISI
jgi:hypothetical protein